MKLTKRELDVMNILWDSNCALTAKEIFDSKDSLSLNTVQAILRKLLEKKHIKIAEIVYSGTVLTRSYIAVTSFNEYILSQINDRRNFSTESIVAALLKRESNDTETINKLDALLKQYRKDMEKR